MDNFEKSIENADRYYKEGRYNEAIGLLEELHKLRRLSPQRECQIVKRLAQVHRDFSEHQYAVLHAKKLVTLEKKLSGDSSESYADALKELALSFGRDNLNKAKQNVLKAMSIMKKLKLEEAESYGTMNLVLGRVNYMEEMLAEAMKRFQKAKQILAKFQVCRDYCLAITHIGYCHLKEKNNEEARKCFDEALDLTLKRVGDKHPDYGSVLFQVAQHHVTNRKYDDAFRMLDETLNIYKASFGDQHGNTIRVVNVITKAHQDMKPNFIKKSTLLEAVRTGLEKDGGLVNETMEYLEEACKEVQKETMAALAKLKPAEVLKILRKGGTPEQIFEAAEGRDPGEQNELLLGLTKDPFFDQMTPEDRIKLNDRLSRNCTTMGDHRAARIYAQFACNEIVALGGKKSERYIMALERLALCHIDLAECDEAIRIILQVLETLPKNHPQRSKFIITWGSAEQRKGNYAVALKIFSDPGLQFDERLYPNVLSCLDACNRHLGKWDQAHDAREKHLRIVKEKYGEESIEHAESLEAMSHIYSNLKQYEMAFVLFRQALDICKQKGNLSKVNLSEMEACLSSIYEKVAIVHREDIKVSHSFRFCNQCGKVSEELKVCNGCYRAWYCDRECQLEHWTVHKSICMVCFTCERLLNRDVVPFCCSKCQNTKYCGEECQRADRKEHKEICK